jgi:hypothetical protein
MRWRAVWSWFGGRIVRRIVNPVFFEGITSRDLAPGRFSPSRFPREVSDAETP